MISACMTVSVRELRTAVREWACCLKMFVCLFVCLCKCFTPSQQFLVMSDQFPVFMS